MGKTFRDKPAKEREITVKKHERGSKRHMDPYVRQKRNTWLLQDQDS